MPKPMMRRVKTRIVTLQRDDGGDEFRGRAL